MSTATAVRNPKVTLNLVSRDQVVGLEDQRILIVGQLTSNGSESAGTLTDMPRKNAEINALFGADSHLAMIARRVRKVNPYTAVDAIMLADAGSTTKGTSSILLAGTATEARTVFFDVVSEKDHSYEVDIEVGDDEAAVTAKVLAKAALDTAKPFTVAKSTVTSTDDTTTFTATNGGTLSNGWMIRVRDAFGRAVKVAGMTITLTGWASGATDPATPSSIFDDVTNIRYQGVVWPSSYSTTSIKSFIDTRFNIDNDIKDGVVFQWSTDTFANVKTAANAMNSASFLIMTNEVNNTATWKGPHLPEAPDVIAASFVAARARRFEDGISISDLVVTNELNDQFGGRHTASLPYFNTPFIGCGQPAKGTGYTYAEQLELENAGVSVVSGNVPNNSVISSVMVLTYQNDAAGNPDDTWHYLNWRDTHSVIREFMVTNLREDLDQHRLTTGLAPANYAIANEALIRGLLSGYFDTLADDALTVKGRPARKVFDDELTVVISPENRRATLGIVTPMVSQFGEAIGTIKFTFDA